MNSAPVPPGVSGHVAPELPAPSALDASIRTLHQAGVVSPPATPGQLGTLGQYELLRTIGAGGMGFVFLARAGEAEVAIKILRPELARDETVARGFLREPRHMMQLARQCPHILPVLAIGEPADGSYFVMPYCAGGSLARLIREQGALPERRVLDICQPLAEALVCAHRCGIIHRDLKPANILLDRDGKPFLADFGLVRTLFNETIVHPDHPECVGTLPYMSPAVAAGEAEDTRCDIYAFGAMMYEMLTATPPYRGNSREELRRQILAGPPPALAGVAPHLRPELVRIVTKAMARDLRHRYTSMAELGDDLRSLAANENRPGTARSGATRRRRVLAGVGVALLGLGAATVLLLRLLPDGPSGPASVTVSDPESPARAAGVTTVGRQPPILPARVIPTDLSATPRLTVTGHFSTVSGLAGICLAPNDKRIYAAVWESDGQSPLIEYDTATGRELRRFPYDNRHCHSDAVLSLDGRYLFATHYYLTAISRTDLLTGKVVWLEPGGVKHAVWAGGIACSPDGNLLAVALGRDGRNYDMHNDQISLVSIRNGEFRLAGEVKLDDELTGRKMAFTADSRWLYAVTTPRQTQAPRLYEIALAEPYRVSRRLDFAGAVLTSVAVSPADGRICVSDSAGRRIWGVSRNSWKAETALALDGAAPTCLLFARDGRHLFAAAEAIRTVFLLDPETGNLLARVPGLGKEITDLEIGHDDRTLYVANGGDAAGVARLRFAPPETVPRLFGRDGFPIELLFASDRSGNYQIHAADRQGKHVRQLLRNQYTETVPRWSPDRRRIAFVSDRNGPYQVFVLEPETGRISAVPDAIVRDMHDGSPFDWSPDGQKIAFIRPDRATLAVADLAAEQTRTLYTADTNPLCSCFASVSWDWHNDRILLSANHADAAQRSALFAVDPRSGVASSLSSGINSPHAQAAASPLGGDIALIWNPDVRAAKRHLCLWDSVSPAAPRRLTAGENTDSLPRWSCTGSELVFASGLGQHMNLFLHRLDTGETVPLTHGTWDDGSPDLP